MEHASRCFLRACSGTCSGPSRISVVALSGELDHDARERMERALIPPAVEGASGSMADLTGVTFVDSSGINMLITDMFAAGVMAADTGRRQPVAFVGDRTGRGRLWT
ncbi:STAS domain-containing protein [Streptomyces sp. NPDC017991]|uniref:STAS domain-containing protein n=1 Tax=Streptomyces sp. NPDC017991 TaxID=3365026 RepID=UPI0037A0A0EE